MINCQNVILYIFKICGNTMPPLFVSSYCGLYEEWDREILYIFKICGNTMPPLFVSSHCGLYEGWDRERGGGKGVGW
jgi:hypothetical protein